MCIQAFLSLRSRSLIRNWALEIIGKRAKNSFYHGYITRISKFCYMFCVLASVLFIPSTKETAAFLWAYRAPTCAKPFSTSLYLHKQTEHYQPTLSISPNNGHNWIVLQAVQPLRLIFYNGCAIHTHRKFSHHRIFSDVRTRTTFSTHRSTVRSNQCR